MSTSNIVSRKATLTLPSQHGDSFGRKSTVANLGRRSTLGRRMSRRFTRKSIAIPTVFEPTYQLESFSTINFDHVNEIIRNCVIWSIPDNMPVYDCIKAAEFTQTLSKEIQARLKLQFYNRYRIVVVVNIFEKKWQQIQWKMMFLWDSENDQWTTFQHEANTFIVNVLVAFVYCDWWFDKKKMPFLSLTQASVLFSIRVASTKHFIVQLNENILLLMPFYAFGSAWNSTKNSLDC